MRKKCLLNKEIGCNFRLNIPIEGGDASTSWQSSNKKLASVKKKQRARKVVTELGKYALLFENQREKRMTLVQSFLFEARAKTEAKKRLSFFLCLPSALAGLRYVFSTCILRLDDQE